MKKTSLIGCLLLTVILLSAQGWEKLGNTPFFKHHSNGFSYDGIAYVFEGTMEEDGSNEVWTYDPVEDIWSRIEDFPGTPRAIAIGDEWDSKYYYGFGRGNGGPLNDLWVFDPQDTSYTQLPSCPCIGRTHPSLVAHNDKVYMGGGSSANGDVKDWWEYDILTQVWTQKTDIPGGNRHHTFHFTVDKYVFVGGGHVANWNRYDPDTDTWNPIDDLPGGRVAGTQLNFGKSGLLLAGDDMFHNSLPDQESFMSYDTETEEWSYLPELPDGSRWAPSSFIIDSDLYFFGGISSFIDSDVSMWKFDLNLIGCLPANSLSAVNVSDTSAGLFWASNENLDTLRWRKLGALDWEEVPDAQAVYTIENLESCQEYEFEVITDCETFSTSSGVFQFKTDGCCINPAVQVSELSANSVLFSWPSILAAENYELRWKDESVTEWENATIVETEFMLDGLSQCTNYEFQIKSICDSDVVEFGESEYFLTKDCGTCIDETYCPAADDFEGQFTFINKVNINGYENETGSNGGYGNFAMPNAEAVEIGSSLNISIEIGSLESFTNSDIAAWIDLNGNAIFEPEEKLIFEKDVENELITSIEIPMDAVPGVTRLRLMSFFGGDGFPCEQESEFVFGEIEDYCLELIGVSSADDEAGDDQRSIAIYPNPFDETIKFQTNRLNEYDAYQIKIYNLIGGEVLNLEGVNLNDELKLPGNMPSGVYMMTIEKGEYRQSIKLVKE